MAQYVDPSTCYGDADMERRHDGTVRVVRADDRIGVHRDLWDGDLLDGHRIGDDTLVLDGAAGQYRYRLVGTHTDGVLIFERIAAAVEPTTGGADRG